MSPTKLQRPQARKSTAPPWLRALENAAQTLWLWISCRPHNKTPTEMKNKYQHLYARPDISVGLFEEEKKMKPRLAASAWVQVQKSTVFDWAVNHDQKAESATGKTLPGSRGG